MTELLSADQMRAVEGAATESGSVTGLQLMERAGRGVVEAVFAQWPELGEGTHHAVVLCGPGNNGGDGYVIARRLCDRGWRVEVFALGDPDGLPPDAACNFEIWGTMGTVQPLDPEDAGKGARPDLLVDALFGTGLTRAIPEAAARSLGSVRSRKPEKGQRTRCRTVAVDCPSGLDCDTGEMLLPPPPAAMRSDDEAIALAAGTDYWSHAQHWIVSADMTVSFHREKIGHYLGNPPMPSRKLAVVDIGIGDFDEPETLSLNPPSPERVRLVGRQQGGIEMPGRVWPGQFLPALQAGAHKYDRGHALVLAGGPGMGGAARLAARAALRVGAGLATIAPPPDALAENAARLDAIMLKPTEGASELSRHLEDDRFTSVCLGPGLGVGERTRELVAVATGGQTDMDAGFRRRVVLDADALTSFADKPEALFELLSDTCVLTPHKGEFARLFPDLSQKTRQQLGVGPRRSKVDAVRAAADRAGCTVLLKGPDTVIASPGGAASIHAALYNREAPWLGTAGSGDVLAGLITGLLASPRAFGSPHPVVEVAAWLHVECARSIGPGLIAEDLPEALPGVLSGLLA